MDNIFSLHYDLLYHRYQPGGYEAFNISDPKPRHIHKANVRDRLLHHAIYRQLYPFFDRTFIADSYSCRLGKGTHKALNRFHRFVRATSCNGTRSCWVLKGDIKRFFSSIDHSILIDSLKDYILDPKIIWLLKMVIGSFCSDRSSRGLPLGNLTSQLFANIYLNKFDQFIKHEIRAKYYIRYSDDFVILSDDKTWLRQRVRLINEFLINNLGLDLHPDKLFIRSIFSGVDFLGWVNFVDHRILRVTTKRRMIRKIRKNQSPESLASYLGLLSHGHTTKLRSVVFNEMNHVNRSLKSGG